jgi:arylformamidase
MTGSDDRRVQFDFEVDFSNGGGIQGQGFRLDIDGDDIDDEALAAYIVHDLRLLMVADTRILNKKIIRERHKRVADASAVPPGADGLTRIDLSHTVEDGNMGAHNGTYVLSPFQLYADGDDLAALPLDRLADLDAVRVDVTGTEDRAIDRPMLLPYDLAGKAVLVHTGWDRHWRTDQYFEGHPFLTERAARHLADEGATLVGIDSLSIDDTSIAARPVQSVVLAAGIPVCEHLTSLGGLPVEGFRFSAVPVKVAGIGTSPVRAYATVPTDARG